MLQPQNCFKIRVSCIVACGDELALIRRASGAGPQWTLPGGNVEIGEDVQGAIVRELKEELGLVSIRPELLFLQDMLIHRPDREGLYRKLHIVFRTVVPQNVKSALNIREEDDRSIGQIQWVERSQIATFHLYPDIASALVELPSLNGPVTPRILPPMTDMTFKWR